MVISSFSLPWRVRFDPYVQRQCISQHTATKAFNIDILSFKDSHTSQNQIIYNIPVEILYVY